MWSDSSNGWSLTSSFALSLKGFTSILCLSCSAGGSPCQSSPHRDVRIRGVTGTCPELTGLSLRNVLSWPGWGLCPTLPTTEVATSIQAVTYGAVRRDLPVNPLLRGDAEGGRAFKLTEASSDPPTVNTRPSQHLGFTTAHNLKCGRAHGD